jgi:hypothetical protein
MTRAISVVVGVLVLLTVGWFFGHRPVSQLETRLEAQETAFQIEKADLEVRAAMAEARGSLWAAHAELMLAARDAEQKNYGTASDRVTRARDLITRVQATPGFTMELGEVRDLAESALSLIGAMDPAAPGALQRAADELSRLLEKVGQA